MEFLLKYKFTSLLILLLISHDMVFGQAMHPKRNEEGLYYELLIGYGKGIALQGSPVSSQTDLHSSVFNFCVGYKRNKHFGLECGIGDYYQWDKIGGYATSSDYSTESIQITRLAIQPAIHLQFGESKIKYYL